MALLHEVTLTWPHSEPQGVIVTGTFDNWSSSVHCSRTAGGFSAKVKVPWGEKVLYKFIVDGNWIAIPTESTETDWRGNINNVYQAPPAPITPPTPPPEPVSLPAPDVATVSTEPAPVAVTASSQPDAPVAAHTEEVGSPEPVVPEAVSAKPADTIQDVEASVAVPVESAPEPVAESTKADELPASSTETASLGLAHSQSTRAADESEKSNPVVATTEPVKEQETVSESEEKPTPVVDTKPAEEIKPTPAESKVSPSEDVKSPPVEAAVPSTPTKTKVEVPKPIEGSPADRHTTPATPKADEASAVVPKTPTKEQSSSSPPASPGSPISRKESSKGDGSRKKRNSIFGKLKRAFSHHDKEKK